MAHPHKLKTIAEVKNFLKKVEKTGAAAGEKYKDFFAKIKVKSEAYPDTENIEDWSSLMDKEPKVVIVAIERYKYENSSDSEKDKNSKVQIKRRIAKALGKSSAEELTEQELNDNLHKNATGDINLGDKTYDENLNEISVDGGDDSGKKGS